MSRASLSVRLYRRVLLLLALAGIAMGAILYRVADHEMGRLADRQLINASRMLYMLMQDELASGDLRAFAQNHPDISDTPLTREDEGAFHASFDSCTFAIFWDGQVIAKSGWGPSPDMVPREAGLHNFMALDARWRSYGLTGQGRKLLIVVAERDALRDLAVSPVLRKLALPLILLLTVGTVVLWWTLRQGLSEIVRLASRLNGRSLADLTPLELENWSSDLGPLILALNKLFARLDQAYELEQAFTDDVAHELRTPLSTIRAQAQLLYKTAPEPLREDVARLIAAVDRANGLIDGMLTLARLDATAVSRRSIDVHALVGDVTAEHLVNLPPDAVDFTVTPDHPVRWSCDDALLKIALSAIIDNAIRHGREGRQVDIAIVPKADELVLSVGDRGPGISPPDRKRLLRRFERGASAAPGSGLGLSIAARAIALVGGAIRLDDREDGPGLLVVLTLPSALD